MSDKLRIGVIGYGRRGTLADLFHQPDARSVVTAVCDINEDMLDDFRDNVSSDVFFTKDYKELLERDDVDAVVILTEDHKHHEHTVASLKAGKHVYLEKPIAITIEDSDEILRVWKESGKKLMMGFNMRYMPMYQTMKKYIDEGFIGDVKAVWVRHFVGRGGSYYYQDWHKNSKYTTSLLLQKGSHDIDVIHYLAGSYTKKVAAFGGLDFYNDPKNLEDDGLDSWEEYKDTPIDVEDNNVLIMELENGVKASYLQCHFTPDYHRNYVVIGTKGRMENSEPDQTITIKSRNTNSLHDKSDIVIHMKDQGGDHFGGDKLIVEGFLDYVLLDKKPKATPLDGRMSVAVGVEATKAIREGGAVKIIPEVEE